MKKYFGLLTVFLTLLLPPGLGANTNLAVLPKRENVVVNLKRPDRSLVQETRTIPLERGKNKIQFAWGNARLVPNSVQLLLPGDKEGVNLQDTVRSDGESTLTWNLQSKNTGEVKVGIAYLLNALKHEVSYRGFIAEDQKTLELKEIRSLYNNSGEDLRQALLVLGAGNIHRRNWKDGETKRFPVYEKSGIPFEKKFVFDAENSPHTPEEQKDRGGLPIRYTVANVGDSKLGDKLLRRGKLRLFQLTDDRQFLVGESRVPVTPVGDSLTLRAGRSRDVTVERKLTNRERLNVTRDDKNRVQMYDLRETLKFVTKNHREEPARIQINESMQGEWEVKKSSHDYNKISADTLKFSLVIPPGGKQTITLETVRHHAGKELP